MNIFATSMSPYESAYNLCDKHLYSQAKEGVQMLVSGLLINGYDPADMPLAKTTGRPHKGGYRNHPATRWTAGISSKLDVVMESHDGDMLHHQAKVRDCSRFT